jgi:hypothetical protein
MKQLSKVATLAVLLLNGMFLFNVHTQWIARCDRGLQAERPALEIAPLVSLVPAVEPVQIETAKHAATAEPQKKILLATELQAEFAAVLPGLPERLIPVVSPPGMMAADAVDLVIGVPTAKRNHGTHYLTSTLKGLFAGATPQGALRVAFNNDRYASYACTVFGLTQSAPPSNHALLAVQLKDLKQH